MIRRLACAALLLLPPGCGGGDRVADTSGGSFEPSWSDEFDVLEKAWLLDQVQHTLHWDGYGADHRSAEQKVAGRGLGGGGWHVFRVDWYPDEYVFFADGVETWRTSAGGVCQTPNWILLTDEFRVDYVRVWRYVPPGRRE